MSGSVPPQSHPSSINGAHRYRPEQSGAMSPIANDLSGSYNHMNDDSQSHSGSTNNNTLEELLARIRELEIHVYGPKQPRTRAFSKQNSIPNESSHGGRADSLGFIERHQSDMNNGIPEEADKEWKLEVKRWKRVPNRYGSADLYDASQKIEDIRRKEQEITKGGFVLSAYDDYDLDGKKLNTFLRIHSGPLLELLRKLITFYPGDDFDILSGKDSTDDTVTFAAPYMIMFAYWQTLQNALSGDHSKDAKTHLKILLDFMKLEHPVTTTKLKEIEEGRCKKISFDKLWLLYPPNTSVYAFKGADERQVVVYAIQNAEMTSKGPCGANRDLTVKCWDVTWHSKAAMFKREFREWIMRPYSGEKAVQNLELVPSKYVNNEQQVREKLIQRGRHYFGLSQGHFLQDYFGDRFPRVFQDEGVRVVVDDATFFKKFPESAIATEDAAQDYGFPENEESLVDLNGKPLDTTLLRCFPKIGVFSLRNKEWALVKVDDLKPVTFRPKAFRKLVIDPENKQIIKAMVEASKLDKPGFSDLVSGKGRGLTVLLHGPPGTGKTLTAECVAEKYQRPLFTISCGDLGTSASDLETNLKEVFQLAVTWKAILLLDEADIFLQERDVHNIERNALVSVFLRELDYFEGILFLSTNRPGDMDEAFVSRIHITLGLNALTKEEQHKIWAIFIKDLDLEDEEKIELLDHVKSKFYKDKLNGRQIRNAVRTALALSQLQNEQVRPKHLDRVMKPTRDYTKYLQELNGGEAENTAFVQGRRLSTKPTATPEDDSD